jgi:hypothetical protein
MSKVEVRAEVSFHDGRFSVKEKRTGFVWKTWLVAKDGDKTAMAILSHKIWEEVLNQESMTSGFIELLGDEGMAAAKEAAESAAKDMLAAFECAFSKVEAKLGQSPDFASMGLEGEPAWKTPVRIIREILEKKQEELINLTPHAITIRAQDGAEVTIPPSGTVARVSTTDEVVGTCPITGAPIVRRVFGEVAGLPEAGMPCIVSALVLSAVPGRAGVYAPDTGPTAIRNDAGQIIAVTRLVAA